MPTNNTKLIVLGLKRVFASFRYSALALAVCAATFAFTVWLPNLNLISHVLSDSEASLFFKLQIPLNLLGSIGTNFTWLSASYIILISVFFGMNVAMVAYYIIRRISAAKDVGMALGASGILSGILGIGCAACGSVIITGLLSLVGASGALVFLPLRGGEFGIIGVVLLAISIAVISKKIAMPLVCAPQSITTKT